MQRCIVLFHNGLFNIVISEDLKKFTEISKKHLTNGITADLMSTEPVKPTRESSCNLRCKGNDTYACEWTHEGKPRVSVYDILGATDTSVTGRTYDSMCSE